MHVRREEHLTHLPHDAQVKQILMSILHHPTYLWVSKNLGGYTHSNPLLLESRPHGM